MSSGIDDLRFLGKKRGNLGSAELFQGAEKRIENVACGEAAVGFQTTCDKSELLHEMCEDGYRSGGS